MKLISSVLIGVLIGITIVVVTLINPIKSFLKKMWD